ncbi:MAG: prolyl oligopeptidase family serine peptidase [Bacteroidales bacterium]|nr:prolyl oligopeptidase family serine peptidase [Bacteroidales bacterium]
MKKLVVCVLFFFCMFCVENALGQSFYKFYKENNTNSKWSEIKSHFTPPDEFQNQYGDYRSPLLFYNGDSVKTKQDWEKRRSEIRNKWMSMMGDWPPIIKDQKLEILATEKRENFTQHRVRFYWMPDQPTEGYLLIPEGKGKKAAVITVFYEPETAVGIGGKPYRDFAYQLTKRGFVTLSLGTAETTKNKTYSIYYPSIENAPIQPLSALAYAAANALEALSKEEDVDAGRIGIVGHSYGGKWAMFASCLYDKFAAAAWIDPGIVFDETKGSGVNYWEPWYLGYHRPPWENTWSKTGEHAKGLYPKLLKDGYDLHELHALMAPRPFLVSGGSSDPVERWIPLNHTIAVNKLLGYTHRVAMTNRPKHDPNEESNRVLFSFFEWFLK